ncbi:MAG: FadR family transcriptional regulator [Thermoleophilia bacterium]|nr:FadR family transcriptional regulator [Thermoleophilia bacterium]
MQTTRSHTPRMLPSDGSIVVAAAQTRASDLAERYLRSLIFSGQLNPGDKLPSERELAVQFGIARITLRAALRSLETVGFLVVKIGSKGGAWVNDAESIRLRWEDWMRSHRGEIAEMLEFRGFIETQITFLAALRRTPEDMELLEATGRPAHEDQTTVVQWHFSFHDLLAKAAHNRHLERAMICIRSELFVPVDWGLTHARVVDIEEVHDKILEAVRAGDAERAADEMRAHLQICDEPFRQALRK